MNETKSTLPAKIGGTEITRFNALRHGVLSRYTVLPWEDAAEYRDLVASLVAEHAPGRPRSIWLRNWRAFFGASAACAWPRPPPIGTGLTRRFRNRSGLRRERSCISTLPTDLRTSPKPSAPPQPTPRTPSATWRRTRP